MEWAGVQSQTNACIAAQWWMRRCLNEIDSGSEISCSMMGIRGLGAGNYRGMLFRIVAPRGTQLYLPCMPCRVVSKKVSPNPGISCLIILTKHLSGSSRTRVQRKNQVPADTPTADDIPQSSSSTSFQLAIFGSSFHSFAGRLEGTRVSQREAVKERQSRSQVWLSEKEELGYDVGEGKGTK